MAVVYSKMGRPATRFINPAYRTAATLLFEHYIVLFGCYAVLGFKLTATLYPVYVLRVARPAQFVVVSTTRCARGCAVGSAFTTHKRKRFDGFIL